MSSQNQQKITSKNLSYSTELPPFLARLRGQQQQQHDSDSPDPILAARRRAARPRSASDVAEEAPLVVDENGQVISFNDALEDEDEESTGATVNQGPKEDNNLNKREKEKEKEKIAGIGAGKKRKVGRVVGRGEDEGEYEDDRKPKTTSGAKGQTRSTTAKDEKIADAKHGAKQGKKKAKKIKLSFGDDAD